LLSALWLSLQFKHLKVWGQDVLAAVASLKELDLRLVANSYNTKPRICSFLLCELPYFWYSVPWLQQVCWVFPVLVIVILNNHRMYSSPLDYSYILSKVEWVINKSLVLKPFWKSQISIQITDILELGGAFIIWVIDANMILLKREELKRATTI